MNPSDGGSLVVLVGSGEYLPPQYEISVDESVTPESINSEFCTGVASSSTFDVMVRWLAHHIIGDGSAGIHYLLDSTSISKFSVCGFNELDSEQQSFVSDFCAELVSEHGDITFVVPLPCLSPDLDVFSDEWTVFQNLPEPPIQMGYSGGSGGTSYGSMGGDYGPAGWM